MSKNNNSSSNSTTLAYSALAVTVLVILGFFLLSRNQQEAVDQDLDLSLQQLDSQSLEERLSSDLEFTEGQLQETTPGTSNGTNSNADVDLSQLTNQTETQTSMNKTNMPKPSMIINATKEYLATMNTSAGVIKIKLFAQQTPVTVNNFVYLAQNNFYDGLIFHRVIDDFMIQGGCPLGTGTSGPGYQFEDEQNPESLVRGSLAMANSGPNTNGSQFFIVTAEATPWLDGLHTHFGQVIEGLDIVMKIGQAQTRANDKPAQDIVINSVTISET